MNEIVRRRAVFVITLAAFLLATVQAVPAEDKQSQSVFARDNLVAWCIVPFDAKKRGPAERAEMVKRLGFTKVAYDWRDEHVPTFEEEIAQYKKHGIEFFAFWDWHVSMRPLIIKDEIHPQIWVTAPSPVEGEQQAKVEEAAKTLMPHVETTRTLKLKLGLYNHGGWGGEPANLVAVCEHLRKQDKSNHIGIVYNLHHGHGHIADFAASLEAMKPYLLCLNLNGMNDGAKPKILPVGSGQHDRQMLQTIRDSGYSGPIGIIHHREDLDAEEGLRQNLEGLQAVLKDLGDTNALETFQK
jgi:sugar phosphate isomerase/epimerase